MKLTHSMILAVVTLAASGGSLNADYADAGTHRKHLSHSVQLGPARFTSLTAWKTVR